MSLQKYQTDHLGHPFEQMTFQFSNDYEGEVVATLVRRKSEQPTQKAVLYIHGFVDYFFQTEMAERFNTAGFHFYALDLRKYGRSHRPHQKWYNMHALNEYDAEIRAALNQIQAEGNQQVVLAGHSTGGLIVTSFSARYPEHALVKAIWANSPFYNFNMPKLKRSLALPHLVKLGHYLPDLEFPSSLNRWYVTSLHHSLKGEWDFNLDWKKKTMPWVRLSFIRAIYLAQEPIYKGLSLPVPALIMHATRTTNPRRWGKDAQSSDIILDVKDIVKETQKMQGDIELYAVEDGLHDLVLSRKDVREQVYQKLFAWLDSKLN